MTIELTGCITTWLQNSDFKSDWGVQSQYGEGDFLFYKHGVTFTGENERTYVRPHFAILSDSVRLCCSVNNKHSEEELVLEAAKPDFFADLATALTKQAYLAKLARKGGIKDA